MTEVLVVAAILVPRPNMAMCEPKRASPWWNRRIAMGDEARSTIRSRRPDTDRHAETTLMQGLTGGSWA